MSIGLKYCKFFLIFYKIKSYNKENLQKFIDLEKFHEFVHDKGLVYISLCKDLKISKIGFINILIRI